MISEKWGRGPAIPALGLMVYGAGLQIPRELVGLRSHPETPGSNPGAPTPILL